MKILSQPPKKSTKNLQKLALTQMSKIEKTWKFDKDRKKSRTVLVTFNTEHEARLVLAESYEKCTELKNKNIFLMPMLSREDALKENLCLKKRRELINKLLYHLSNWKYGTLNYLTMERKSYWLINMKKLTDYSTWPCCYWILEAFGKQREEKNSWMQIFWASKM